MNENIWTENSERILEVLNSGGVVVMPTDTIYGMVAKAENEQTVLRVYDIRQRAPEKPFILLISDWSDVGKFGVSLNEAERNFLQESFARPTSIILDCPSEAFAYLHRGTHSLGFRVPAEEGLRNLLKKTGPLIAPSANIEKFPQSESIDDARKYFDDKVDLYIDDGPVVSQPSRLIRLHHDGTIDILRV